jgi:hypothetical protein
VVLGLCTGAIVAVILAIYFRIKRHLRQEHIDAQVRTVIENATEAADQENRAKSSS